MACTPTDFQTLAQTQGFVYHVTDRHLLNTIMSQGVRPWDHTGNAKFAGVMQARSGHTYWALATYNQLMEDLEYGVKAGTIAQDHVALKVPLSSFDPTKVNPDEDAFVYQCIDESGLQTMGLGSFGEWADVVDLGGKPSDTIDAIQNTQSFAYKGHIEPCHITVCEFQRQPLPHGANQWVIVPTLT